MKKERLNIISSLKECGHSAENNNVELIFEPINRFEVDSYNTISESVKLIEEIRSDNLKLLITKKGVKLKHFSKLYHRNSTVYVKSGLEE